MIVEETQAALVNPYESVSGFVRIYTLIEYAEQNPSC